MLAKPEIKSLFPADLIFRWSKDPLKPFTGSDGEISDFGENQYQLYAIKKQAGTGRTCLGRRCNY